MSDQSLPQVPCDECGTMRDQHLMRALGMERTVLLNCPKCEAAREKKQRERNLKAILSYVEAWSIRDSECEEWTLETHPDPEAQEIGKSLLPAFPDPLDRLLAMRDWSTAGPDEQSLLRGAQRNAMKRVPGVLFVGKPGRGKSGLAASIHREMRSRGIPGCQVNIAILFDEMRARYRDSSLGTVEDLMRPLRMTPLLTLDDLDKLHSRGSNDEILKLYGIVQARIGEQMPIMVTSNSTFRELGQKLEALGADGSAVMDRLAKTTPLSFTLKSPFSFRRMEAGHLQSVDGQ